MSDIEALYEAQKPKFAGTFDNQVMIIYGYNDHTIRFKKIDKDTDEEIWCRKNITQQVQVAAFVWSKRDRTWRLKVR